MEQPMMVTIQKHFLPDTQVVIRREEYNREKHFLVSLVISESVIVEEECDEEGFPKRGFTERPEYKACRLNKDIIEICDVKYGWMPAEEELNSAYANTLADKALLEEKHG